MSSSTREFEQRLLTSSQHVLTYEKPSLQAKARSVVPLQELEQRATQSSGASDRDPEFRDALLVELLHWFKNEFFTWFDAGHCRNCNRSMVAAGPAIPREEELRYGAGRVEQYQCDGCGSTLRFPRYNDPEKLLETRKGRCGEWANCFTLICRSLEYDCRYVLDWTDHVWTEVYSNRLRRWLHCDSCEAACDKPLLYDVGWGKKLTYVIAFSKDEVQDVTWRYARDHREVLQRRKLVPESWLLAQTSSLSRRLQSPLSDPGRGRLTMRLVGELAEFMLPKRVKPGEEQGRISGDLNWRTLRGEVGQPLPSSGHKPVVWIPSEQETDSGEFSLEYSTSLDEYVRRSDGDRRTEKWSNGVFQADCVFRKHETDWNMAYLARTEGSDKGVLSWKFDLSSTNLVILQASVSCPGTTYEDGLVQWKICGDDRCQLVPNGCVDFEVDLTGSKWCVLSVELSRGRGANAWQHAQIARQSTGERHNYPFAFRVLFGSMD